MNSMQRREAIERAYVEAARRSTVEMITSRWTFVVSARCPLPLPIPTLLTRGTVSKYLGETLNA